MPWQNNDLVLIRLNQTGQIQEQRIFDKEFLNIKKKISFFQPHWLDQKCLVCSEDSSGWWNLLFLEIEDSFEIKLKKRLIKKQYEYGTPQWISGISLFSGTKENFFCLAIHNNIWILEHYQNLTFRNHIQLPFTYLSSLHVEKKKLIFIAANSSLNEQLIEMDLEEKKETIRVINEKLSIDQDNDISRSKSFWFQGYKKKKTHSWIYMPLNNFFDKQLYSQPIYINHLFFVLNLQYNFHY